MSYRLAAVAALAALASVSAQGLVEITARDGDMLLDIPTDRMVLVRTGGVSGSQERVATDTDVDNLSTMMSSMMSQLDVRINEESTAASNAAATLSVMTSAAIAQETEERTTASNTFSTAVAGQLGDLSTTMTNTASQLDQRITSSVNTLSQSVVSATANTLSRTNAQSTAVARTITTLTANINTKKNDLVPQWIGGARDWGSSGGWRVFKLDRIDYDSCSGYCQRTSSTQLTVRTAGMWEMKFWAIVQGKDMTHSRFQIYVGSRRRDITHPYHQGNSNWRTNQARHYLQDRWWWGYWRGMGWAVYHVRPWTEHKWNDQQMTQEYKFAVGNRFQTEMWNSQGHRWHQGNYNTASTGTYNRVYFTFKGRAAAKCSSCYW